MRIIEKGIEFDTNRVLYINRETEFLVKIHYSKKFLRENGLEDDFVDERKVTQIHSRYLYDIRKRNRIAFENDIGRYGMWKYIRDIELVEILEV